jgi:hypothetical protein
VQAPRIGAVQRQHEQHHAGKGAHQQDDVQLLHGLDPAAEQAYKYSAIVERGVLLCVLHPMRSAQPFKAAFRHRAGSE